MADLSIDEAIKCIEDLPYQVARKALSIMRQECPVGATGELKKSLYRERLARNVHVVGTDCEYAKYVINGRGPVHPVQAKALRWEEYRGSQTSTHTPQGPPGSVFYRRSAGPTQPNDFVGRTKQRLEELHFDIRGNAN